MTGSKEGKDGEDFAGEHDVCFVVVEMERRIQ